MADNVELNSGSGGATIKTDDDGTAHWQYVKLAYGADNTQTRVTTAAPLPVDLRTDNLSGNLDVNIAAQTSDVTIADGGNSITIDNADITTIAGAVSGTEMQVDVVAPLPAGTNAIGKLSANSGVDIGDVDVTSIVPGTGATNLGKAEDAGHTTGDVGVMALAVRQTADAPLSGTDLDYEPLQTDENGYLKVNIKAGGGSGGTSSTDDSAFTAGSGSGTPMMGFATSDTVDSGDVGVLAMDTSRNLKVSIEADNAGIGGGTQYTEDDAAAANPVGTMNMAVRADSLSAVTSTDGDNIALRSTNNGELYVKQTDAVPVTDNGGSLTVDGTVTADAGTGTFTVAGVAAENAAVSGNPLLSGGRYDASPRTLGDGDVGAIALDADGAVQVSDGGNSLTVDSSDLSTISGAVSGTEMQVDVVAALPAGTNAIGKLAANSGVDIGDVDVTSISAGSNLIGDVGISGARTSGGTTLYKNIDVDESEDQVKGSAGQVYWIHAINISSGVRFLKFYNATAASVTVGTTVPDLTFPIPTQGDTNGAGFTISIPNGIAFGTAITIAATTGVADADSGAPGANEVIVNLGYA